MSRQNHRDRWAAKVIKAKALPSSTRLFLSSVLVRDMRANGHVSVPRAQLAARLGVDERTITRHVTKARETGWLVVVQAGYRGRTAEYQATFPNTESGTSSVPLSEPLKGDTFYPPFRGTNVSPFPTRKRDIWCPTKGSSTTTYGVEALPHADRDGSHRRDVLALERESSRTKSNRHGRHHTRTSAVSA